MTLSIGSLFSGIGGLELGLEWAGLGPVLFQVEKDPKCRAVLAKHWPEAKRYEDVCAVGASTLASVDLVCGGFPCQDVSSAGTRTGLAGARSGLWVEFARIVAQCRPRWVVVENVRSGARKWVDQVRRDLGKLGYASLPIPVGASDLGAPHERARVFIVAAHVQERPVFQARLIGSDIAKAESSAVRGSVADADGDELRLEHRQIGGASGTSAPKSSRRSSHAHHQGQLQPRRPEREVGRWPCDADRIWAVEPSVARVVHGLPGRVERERALGNSVVPQCAEVIGHVIRQLMVGAA